jgi:hypothetical protein
MKLRTTGELLAENNISKESFSLKFCCGNEKSSRKIVSGWFG